MDRVQIKKLVPKRAIEMYKIMRKKFIEAEFRFFGHSEIVKNRVVFCNVWGYGDNPRWVAEALLRKKQSLADTAAVSPEIIFITDTSKAAEIPKGIIVYRTNTPEAIRALATARVWVDCNRKEPYIRKRKGQYYIQTWHGSLPLKKIEGDCKAELTDEYMKNAARDTKMTNLYLSDSPFCDEIYRKAFNYNGRIIHTGSPRLDVLLDNNRERREEYRRAITQSDEKELIVVYAPTFRGNGGGLPSSENAESIADAFAERFGKKVKVIKRLHPLAMTKAERGNGGDGLVFGDRYTVDGNSYGDLYELLAAADVLITDYSNTLFEFAMAGRPVFLYAPDKAEYAETRGMYFDYDSLPFPVAENVEELRNNIVNYDEEAYTKCRTEFFKRLGVRENGDASERVAEIIMKVISG